MLNLKKENACGNHAICALVALVVAVFALAGCSAPVEKTSISDYSWAELSAIAAEIHAADDDAEGMEIAENYHLTSGGKLDGKTKKITLSDGTQANVMIAGIRADDLADGGKAGLTFVFADAPAVHAMSGDASNEGGWEKSAG